MKSKKNNQSRTVLTSEEAAVLHAHHALATQVRYELAQHTIPVEDRNYLALMQIAEELYKRMLEHPYKDPLDLAKDVMDEMYAEFLEAKGEHPDSSINSSN